jgi:catechol 2,3-dioxygenase-like lactoylglutathione lyase family enzyme
MTDGTPRVEISAVVLGSADPRNLAAFYSRLLGWEIAVDEGPRPGEPAEDGWVMLREPSGGTGLSFQYEPGYAVPRWPTAPGEQQMMIHLDIGVSDLDAGVALALAAGATLAERQPQADVRVMLDPAGHPFCLFPAPI